jgi:Small Multidrug Resistance protein
MYLLLAILAAIAYTIGGTFMKLSSGFSEFAPSLMVYVCFLVGATLQIFLLNQTHMGISYILVLGLDVLKRDETQKTWGWLCDGHQGIQSKGAQPNLKTYEYLSKCTKKICTIVSIRRIKMVSLWTFLAARS